jgi:hypothetical protein
MFGTALYSQEDRFMPLFFSHDAKTQNQQPQTTAAAQQPALQTLSQQQTKPKG